MLLLRSQVRAEISEVHTIVSGCVRGFLLQCGRGGAGQDPPPEPLAAGALHFVHDVDYGLASIF